jgi:hypothetical protein
LKRPRTMENTVSSRSLAVYLSRSMNQVPNPRSLLEQESRNSGTRPPLKFLSLFSLFI